MDRCRRECYDVSFKLKAVECAERKSKEAATGEYGVDAKRIRVWCSQKDNLVALKSGKSKSKRLCGGGRKAPNQDMEEALFSWIVD